MSLVILAREKRANTPPAFQRSPVAEHIVEVSEIPQVFTDGSVGNNGASTAAFRIPALGIE